MFDDDKEVLVRDDDQDDFYPQKINQTADDTRNSELKMSRESGIAAPLTPNTLREADADLNIRPT